MVLLAARISRAYKTVDRAEPFQARPVGKGVAKVITPDEHSPASDGALRQNKKRQNENQDEQFDN